MLYTDSDLIGTTDLLAIDQEITAVAKAEEITVEGDGGIIRQAWNECGDALLEAMVSFGPDLTGWQPIPSIYWGRFGTTRTRVLLPQIIVGGAIERRDSAIRRWLTYTALTLFFRAASNRRSNDRYERKMARYEQDRAARLYEVWQAGIPAVIGPLSRPGALHDWAAGQWTDANVASVAGTAAGGSYEFAITWTGPQYQSQASKQNSESAPSDRVMVTLASGYVGRASIAGLNPPGSVASPWGTSDGLYTPIKASGWNVYAGAAGAAYLYLQNASPLPLTQQTYTLTGDPVQTGYLMQPGQYPDANFMPQKLALRA